MPYKSSGKWVLIKRNGRWVLYKRHESEKAAEMHAKALNANVTERGK